MIISQRATILNITEPADPTHLTVLENGAIYDLNILGTYETVLLAPYRHSKGGTVSMMMLELVRSFCDTLAAYPVEFATEIPNVRLPFVSL